MLKKIFKRYRIEILREGNSFNGVYVSVRVHYLHPVKNDWDWHDGIGAIALQTQKGTSPADLTNINNGALSMAFPIAKSIAIKDACDHIGEIFGSNLNRKDIQPFATEKSVSNKVEDRIKEALSKCETSDDFLEVLSDCPEKFTYLVKEAMEGFEVKSDA